MKQQLYVIYDRVQQESSNIMQAKNDAFALRLMDRAMENNPDALDYVLFRIGSFDTERMTGEFNDPVQVMKFEGGNE